jgi:phosphopantothenoylcysteine decarboxylase/phosphopantothenate--cysteine ligase
VNRLTNKRILLGITGGIAAYKSAELTRRLQDEGAEIRCVMTSAAQAFITPLTMQALSNNPVHTDLLDTEMESAMGHIELARWADIIVIAPATADFIARLNAGQGDDLLTTLCLASQCPIAVAPAMNQAMWAKDTTQNNLLQLKSSGITILEPGEGLQACGDVGEGRLMEVPDIVDAVANQFAPGLLIGRHVVITAGPTREAIDPVRYISNNSSGKQGYALAAAALDAGARVTLVTGPTSLTPPERAEVHQVISADEMLAAVMSCIGNADIFIGVAAVSDYKPVAISEQKLKKNGEDGLTLKLTQNPDIIRAVSQLENRPFTVGFAAETENVVAYAQEKLTRKNLDMIVANNVGDKTIGFGSDDNETVVIDRNEQIPLPKMSKDTLSRALIKQISLRIN